MYSKNRNFSPDGGHVVFQVLTVKGSNVERSGLEILKFPTEEEEYRSRAKESVRDRLFELIRPAELNEKTWELRELSLESAMKNGWL